MRRVLTATFALIAALGAPASLAGGEPRTLSSTGVLTCLRSTAADGALTLVKAGAGGYATERVAVTPTSLRLAGPVGLRQPEMCPRRPRPAAAPSPRPRGAARLRLRRDHRPG